MNKLILFSLISLFTSSFSFAYSRDDLYATCRTLGELRMCGQVSVCREESDGGQCQATQNALNSNAQWATTCPLAGPNQLACSWQASCRWEVRTQCLPNN